MFHVSLSGRRFHTSSAILYIYFLRRRLSSRGRFVFIKRIRRAVVRYLI